MIMGPKAFLMIALTASGIAAGSLLLGSCAGPCGRNRPTVQEMKQPALPPEPEASPTPPPPSGTSPLPAAVISDPGRRRTLFEKNANRTECKTNPALCDGDYFEMDIKKEMKLDLAPEEGVSTEFCAGGCSKKSVLQWRLDW
jgi:hypothetical protein